MRLLIGPGSGTDVSSPQLSDNRELGAGRASGGRACASGGNDLFRAEDAVGRRTLQATRTRGSAPAFGAPVFLGWLFRAARVHRGFTWFTVHARLGVYRATRAL